MIHALIFDFDGLILNTETADFRAWSHIYAQFGQTLPRGVWEQNIGAIHFDPYVYLQAQVGHPLHREQVMADHEAHNLALVHQMSLLPGVDDYLQAARQAGLKIGIASSSAHRWVDSHLARLGIGSQFDSVCCRDDVGNVSKPDPAVYLAALDALGVAPQQAIALEDSPNGAMAAKAAGLWCVTVPNEMTRHLPFPPVDLRLESLAALPLTELLRRLAHPF